jgi:hypothetical protein
MPESRLRCPSSMITPLILCPLSLSHFHDSSAHPSSSFRNMSLKIHHLLPVMFASPTDSVQTSGHKIVKISRKLNAILNI